MIIESGGQKREVLLKELSGDLAITGGGLAGVCCAITAARAGLKVILVQDRPVLGGNASSEVRLWILGATSHMGNNNRWAREGGVDIGILEVKIPSEIKLSPKNLLAGITKKNSNKKMSGLPVPAIMSFTILVT